MLSEYLKFRGYLTAMYAYVCNTITVLISCHISYLPIFFICMNNSIHWCINRYFNFGKNMVIETFKQFGDVFKICTTPRCLHYDVNFPHSSQYCKVSLKLCTKNRFRKSMEKGGGGNCHTVPLLVGATDQIVARTCDGNAIFMNVRKAIQHVT